MRLECLTSTTPNDSRWSRSELRKFKTEFWRVKLLRWRQKREKSSDNLYYKSDSSLRALGCADMNWSTRRVTSREIKSTNNKFRKRTRSGMNLPRVKARENNNSTKWLQRKLPKWSIRYRTNKNQLSKPQTQQLESVLLFSRYFQHLQSNHKLLKEW